MADPQCDTCEQWLADEQRVHERAQYGSNHQAVTQALQEQKRRVKVVQEFEPKVSKAKKAAKDDKQREAISTAYEELGAVANHREACLQDISRISSLEQSFNTLTMEFAQRASELVSKSCSDTTPPGSSSEGMGRAAQSCILAVNSNWKWISTLMKCSEIHLKNASDFHQFFHEVKEYEAWMPGQLQRSLQSLSEASATAEDIHKLMLLIKETITLFLHWQKKLTVLFEKSGKVVPVNLRTSPVSHYRPITSLCDYVTSEIAVQEGEELTLLDNSQTQEWLVRNMHAIEAKLPSVICLIPGPDPDALKSINKLRVKLLSMWTLCIKSSGSALIYYFLYVFKDWDDLQMKKLISLPTDDKLRLRQNIRTIQEVFTKYWGKHTSFVTLDPRLNNTAELLMKQGKVKDNDKEFTRVYKGHTKNIEEMLLHFMSCLRQWETYKVLVETSQHSDHMLLIDTWQNLKYFNTEDVVEQADITLNDDDNTRMLSDQFHSSTVTEVISKSLSEVKINEISASQIIDAPETKDINEALSGFNMNQITVEENVNLGATKDQVDTGTKEEVVTKAEEQTEEQGSSGFDEQTTTTTTTTSTTTTTTHNGGKEEEEYEEWTTEEVQETEEVSHAEGEERKTFVITGVIDPRNGEEVSMQEAVRLGIINSAEGLYVDQAKNTSIPIPEAMNQGFIKVEFSSTQKSAEKRSEVGLMTIKTQKESRPYTITGVMDAKLEKTLTVDEAISVGILDQQKGLYKNTLSGSQMSLSDALDSGYLLAEYDNESTEHGGSEVVTKTYAIHAVVDQKTHDKVSFAKAVRLGLLDRETGAYYHNVDKQHIFVGDAIKRGFIKATVVDDPNDLDDIAPENKMVVEKVDVIRKKLLNPLKSVAAFQYAAHHKTSSGNGGAKSKSKKGKTNKLKSSFTSSSSSSAH